MPERKPIRYRNPIQAGSPRIGFRAEFQIPKAMDLVEVYNGNIFQCQMVKNLLENEGIPSVLADEIIGTRSPVWAPGAGVRVRVPENYSTKARQVVALYEKSQGAPRL